MPPVIVQSRRRPPPPLWNRELSEMLIEEHEIQERVLALGREIESEYARKELLVVALLTGTVLFLGDLIRRLNIPLRLDFMGVSSYRHGTSPSELVFNREMQLDARGKHVLVVDDILDTGNTLHRVLERLRDFKPASLKVCVLLDKPMRRRQPVQADFVGFEIPDLFVVGYGMDHDEQYRNLPFVGVLQSEVANEEETPP